MSGVIPVAACIVCALVYRFSQNLDLNLTLSVVRNLSHIISCLTLVSGYFTRCIMTSLLHKFTHTLKEVAEEFSNEIDNAKLKGKKKLGSWWYALEKHYRQPTCFTQSI